LLFHIGCHDLETPKCTFLGHTASTDIQHVGVDHPVWVVQASEKKKEKIASRQLHLYERVRDPSADLEDFNTLGELVHIINYASFSVNQFRGFRSAKGFCTLPTTQCTRDQSRVMLADIELAGFSSALSLHIKIYSREILLWYIYDTIMIETSRTCDCRHIMCVNVTIAHLIVSTHLEHLFTCSQGVKVTHIH
jgi:hypothetical protein